MTKLYLIEGDNSFLIKQEIDKIINNKDLEMINIDLENKTIDDVIETLDTYDMFGKQKLVIVSNQLKEVIPCVSLLLAIYMVMALCTILLWVI